MTPSAGKNVLGTILTLRKDNPRNQFVVKTTEGKLLSAGTIWFKGKIVHGESKTSGSAGEELQAVLQTG